MRRSALTQARLRQVLRYNPYTGLFTWIDRTSNRICVGDIAGQPYPSGYTSICIDGTRYLAHRLAWLYVAGRWPSDEIDHKNGDRRDNRWSNLREVPRRMNAENMRRARIDNSTGVLGVRRMRDKYQANIRVSGRTQNLGTYSTPERAHAAYVEAKRRLHRGCTL